MKRQDLFSYLWVYSRMALAYLLAALIIAGVIWYYEPEMQLKALLYKYWVIIIFGSILPGWGIFGAILYFSNPDDNIPYSE